MAKIEINDLTVEYNGAGFFPRWTDDQGRKLHLQLAHDQNGIVRPLAIAETTKGWSGPRGRWLYRNDPDSVPPRERKRTQVLDAFNAANKATVEEVLRLIDVNAMVPAAIRRAQERAEQKARADREQRVRGIRERLAERRRKDEISPSAVEMFDLLMAREDNDLLELSYAMR